MLEAKRALQAGKYHNMHVLFVPSGNSFLKLITSSVEEHFIFVFCARNLTTLLHMASFYTYPFSSKTFGKYSILFGRPSYMFS
jgi:hypothetical protein